MLSQRSTQCDPCRSLPVDAAGWSVAIGRSTRGCGGQGPVLPGAGSTSRTGVRGGCALPLASAFTFVRRRARPRRAMLHAALSSRNFKKAISEAHLLVSTLPTCWKGTCANQTLPPAMYDCGGNAMLGSIVRDRASSIEQTDTVHTTCATSVDTRLVLTP